MASSTASLYEGKITARGANGCTGVFLSLQILSVTEHKHVLSALTKSTEHKHVLSALTESTEHKHVLSALAKSTEHKHVLSALTKSRCGYSTCSSNVWV